MSMGTAIGVGVGVLFTRFANSNGGDGDMAIKITRSLPAAVGGTVDIGILLGATYRPNKYNNAAFAFRLSAVVDSYWFGGAGSVDLSISKIYDCPQTYLSDAYYNWVTIQPTYSGNTSAPNNDFAIDIQSVYVSPASSGAEYHPTVEAYALQLRLRRTLLNQSIAGSGNVPVTFTLQNLSAAATFEERTSVGTATTPLVKLPPFQQQIINGRGIPTGTPTTTALTDDSDPAAVRGALIQVIKDLQKLGIQNT